MALSPYTFRGALSVLHLEGRRRSVLEKLFGTAIFGGAAAAAITAGPVAGLTAAAWLALVDPKNEAVSLLDGLVDDLLGLLHGARDLDQRELVVAAHTITTVSAFFDALPITIGDRYGDLELTDAERRRLSDVPGTEADDLFGVEVLISSPEAGLEENLTRNLRPYYERLAGRCLAFFTGLEAWAGPRTGLREDLVDRAVLIYRARMLQLSPSPPFSLWVTLNEFTATRDLVRTQAHTQALAMGELRTLLTMALSGTPAGPNRCREQLQLVAREVLDEPLLRSRVPSITSPTVRDGFVEPSFQFVQAGADVRPHDESWWSRRSCRPRRSRSSGCRCARSIPTTT